VADDFGDLGRCWRETDIQATDLETVIADMLKGEDVASELQNRRETMFSAHLQGFIERHVSRTALSYVSFKLLADPI
jgi:hypothetical protein